MANEQGNSSRTGITGKGLLKRWFIDALGAMAQGLFASLIIGLILSQLSMIPGLGFLQQFADVLSADSPVVGAAIGVAIAYGDVYKRQTFYNPIDLPIFLQKIIVKLTVALLTCL